MLSVVVAQIGYSGPPRQSRNLEERLTVRFPRAWRALAALLPRLLSPRSRLRRTVLRRQVVSGWDAGSRRDFELMLVRYSPAVEVQFDPDFEPLGLGGTFRGHDGMLKMIEAFGEPWEHWEVLPATALDLGDRLLVLGAFHLPGNVSGMELDREFAQLVTIRGGLVVRGQEFLAWDKGLRAAGVDPDAIGLSAHPEAGHGASSAR